MAARVLWFLVGFLLISSISWGAHIDTLTFTSKAMGQQKKICVAVPVLYNNLPTARFQVVYLLHGAGGKYASYLKRLKDSTLIQRLADGHQVIIVMPDADTMSYYVDSPNKPQSQAETLITQEVVQFIDRHYRTIAKRKGRAIVGFSMGGHGALYLASRHPGVYCAAGSMSGAVDLNLRHWKRDARFRRIRDSVFTVLMGPKSTADTAVPFPPYTVLERVAQLKKAKLALMLDCGTEDFLILPNRILHARLAASQVTHTYLEYPGKHDWDYWTKALSAQVAFAVGAMRSRN